ncbi:hypothetical protein ST45_09055 [Prevotella pectinovora]|nr:hypothetical protein ST45_09055 [Prevotella pectinovora]
MDNRLERHYDKDYREIPPQRGEQHPLMWGFIPHAVGKIRTYISVGVIVWIMDLNPKRSSGRLLYLLLPNQTEKAWDITSGAIPRLHY